MQKIVWWIDPLKVTPVGKFLCLIDYKVFYISKDISRYLDIYRPVQADVFSLFK